MRFFRSERVQELIRRELGEIIEREVDFADTLVTITDVRVDKKLAHAAVHVSVIPSSEAAGALAALGRQAGKLQRLLTKKMNIKPMPRISFAIDRGPENAASVEKILSGK
jgi:ribosome-binding factor A